MRHHAKNHTTPDWIKQGIVLASRQEALVFLQRAGMTGVNGTKEHFSRFSEAELEELKRAGVTLVFVSGQKGAGFQAEQKEILFSKEAAERCHRLGLKVGTYIGNTLLSETLFAEIPEARSWAVVNAYGEPHYYAPQQTFRYVGCRNNPGYFNFLKKVTRICLEEIQADFLHYDNMFSSAEPYWCRCDHCRKRFRTFLSSKYTPAELQERFGFQNLELFNPPNLVRFHTPWQGEPWRYPVVTDPLMQDWIDFQCEALAHNMGELAAYARSLKPDVMVECNPFGLDQRINPALFKGVDHQRLLPHVDAFWSEEGGYACITPEGDLVNRVRNYKLARTFDQVLFTYLSGKGHGSEPLNVAESLAFNPLSLVGLNLTSARGQHVLRFWQNHKELFIDTETVADVALLRQFETQAYFPAEPRLQCQLAEQTLIQAHIPWDLIFDRQLQAVSGYRALVLPEVVCLSDQQIDLIRRRVKEGLGLVITGSTSSRNLKTQLRPELPLGELWGETSLEYNRLGIAVRKEFGQGRVAYLPKLELRRPVEPDEKWGYLAYGSFQLPGNWRELAEAVEWAARGFSIILTAPETVLAEFLRQPSTGRILVHLVNYKPEEEVAGIRIRFAPELVSAAKREVSFLTYDSGERHVASRPLADGSLEVMVDWLGQYGLIVLE